MDQELQMSDYVLAARRTETGMEGVSCVYVCYVKEDLQSKRRLDLDPWDRECTWSEV